jgi:asparagine synthase (glutamine-hydrolysing)
MCGIAGRLNFRSGRPVDADLVHRMCRLIAHRGPDGEGVYTDGPLGLGHRRLAIIDLSDAGRQPMMSHDGRYCITFNGEIYNFQELRALYASKGHRFRSHTDTEVILAAYREHGVDCLGELRGMFAFAIWDTVDRTLFMARDRLGKKPLYYRLDEDGLSFASEPKAFLAEESFRPRPNPTAISQYLSYQYVPTPLSAFEGVERLRPAHYLLLKNGQLTTRRYWKLSYQPKRTLSDPEACELVLSELREATRLRLISDVPLGAFLSGGVDSSVVVALMAQLGSGPVKTFSIGFEERTHDELPYARLMAERYATDHREFIVRPDASEVFADLAWYYNEPFADSSAIPTYYLSRLTRQHVTVALNGDAGDESFAGYTRYSLSGAAACYDRVPAAVRGTLAGLIGRIPAQAGGAGTWPRLHRLVSRGGMSPERRYALGMMQFPPDMMAELCTPAFLAAAAVSDSAELLTDEFAASDAVEPVDRMMDVDVNRYLPDALLVKVDIATMAFGLEGRSPLLDHKFMETAASLPAHMKRRDGVSKYIFKQAARSLIPREIIDRPKKGFSVPLDHWFRHELKELARDLLLDTRAAQRGYFHKPVVERLLTEHASGVRQWNEQLWNLLMLELWHRTFVDARPGEGRLGPLRATDAVGKTMLTGVA